MAARTQASLKKTMDAIDLILDEQENLVGIQDNDLVNAAVWVCSKFPNAQGRAVRLAQKTIALVNRKMSDPNVRPSDLPNVIDYAIETTLSANELDHALDNAKIARDEILKHSISGEHDKPAVWRDQQTATLIEAIVRKYFLEKLKASKSKRKSARMADLTPAEKDSIKDWLQQHVTDITYVVPENDDNSYLGNNAIPVDDVAARDESNDRIQAGWDSEVSALYKKFPALRKTAHIEPRLTSHSDDTRKDLWHISAITTFDTPVDSMPDLVKRMIEIARSQSNKDDLKTMAEIKDDKKVSSKVLADTIIALFDGNPDFYKNNMDTEYSRTMNALTQDMPEYEPEPEADDSVVPDTFDSDVLLKDYE